MAEFGNMEDIKNRLKDNPPDDAARIDIEHIKETCREKIAHHEGQYEKLMMLAKQHEYAAQQYRIIATAGDPVPADPGNGIGL
jgi:hypothetical protein